VEIVLAVPAVDRARDLAVALATVGVDARMVCGTGAELHAYLGREPAEGVVLVEELPDGLAEEWLRRVAALPVPRPAAVVLVYRTDNTEQVRERVRAVYGLAAEVVAAGARPGVEVAREVADVLQRLRAVAMEQEREAHQRLSRPVPGAPVPVAQPGGVLAFAGVTGGVGVSTLVANLAAVAAAAGHRVLVVDAQFGTGGSLLFHLGARQADGPGAPDVRRLYHEYTLHQRQEGRGSGVTGDLVGLLREVVIPITLQRVRHAPLGVVQVPADPEVRAQTPAELVLWVVQGLMASRDWDVALMDCGSSLGDPRVRRLLQSAREVFLLGSNRGSSVHGLIRTVSLLGSLELRTPPMLLLRVHEASMYTEAQVNRFLRQAAPGMATIYGTVPQAQELEQRENRLLEEPPLAVVVPEAAYSMAVRRLAVKLGLADAQPDEDAARRKVRLWPFSMARG